MLQAKIHRGLIQRCLILLMNLNLLGNYFVPSTMTGAASMQKMYESQHLDPKMSYSLAGKRRF